MFRNSVFLAVAVSLVVLLTMGAPSASADSMTIELAASNLSGFPDGTVYATVNLNRNQDGSITVTVTAGTNFGLFGQGGMLGMNVIPNLSSLSFSGFTNGASLALNKDGTVQGGTMDGFGFFELQIDGSPASQAVNSFSFTVNRTGGFSSVSDLASPGLDFASAHVIFTDPITGQAVTGFTGFVPEPGTLALLGTGLLAVGGRLRRRLNR